MMNHGIIADSGAGRRSVKRRRAPARTSGFTLVELMVAMAAALIMIMALAQIFAYVGQTVSEGRAAAEMMGNLRGVAHRLDEDLAGLTVAVRPWADRAAGPGYFEYLEGVGTDLHPLPELPGDPLAIPTDSSGQQAEMVVADIYGDIDDVLAFTAYADNAPFRGDHVGTAIQSQAAEIVWFTRFEDFNENQIPDRGEVMLYRRVLLIRPDVTLSRTDATAVGLMLAHYRESDVSARPVWNAASSQWELRANSLADLANRRNRFAHYGSSMLYPISRRLLVPRGTVLLKRPPGSAAGDVPGFDGRDDDLNGTADDDSEIGWFGSDDVIDVDLANIGGGYGSDRMLTELLAFDVRAFDPWAEVRAVGGEPVIPGDPGWTLGTATKVGEGAFVDLNYANMPNDLSHPYALDSASRWSPFSGLPMFLDQNGNGRWSSSAGQGERFLGVPYAGTTAAAVPSLGLIRTLGVAYDTWPRYYEQDGVDQDNDTVVDEATNGFDDDGASGVDDVGERETAPPYPVPLRGIQITVRTWDPDWRQVRQLSIVADFIPE